MRTLLDEGSPCASCDRPMYRHGRRVVPEGWVRHASHGNCARCTDGLRHRKRAAARRMERTYDPLITEHLPVEPLVAFLDAVVPDPSLSGLWRQAYRALQAGYVTVSTGDRIACSILHVHPYAIWGDAWWDAAAMTDEGEVA